MARITKLNLAKKTTWSDLPDSTPLLHRRARRDRVIALSPKRQIPQQRSYCSQGTSQDQETVKIRVDLYPIANKLILYRHRYKNSSRDLDIYNGTAAAIWEQLDG